MRQFERIYELIICRPSDKSDKVVEVPEFIDPLSGQTPKTQAKEYEGSSTINATNVIIRDLHIEVTVSKSTRGGSNKQNTTLKIYNLSRDNRSVVESKGAYVVLKAGYKEQEGNLPVIFMGQVVDATTEKVKQDIVTEIALKDGMVGQNNQIVTRAFPPNTSVKEVIDTMALEFSGISKGALYTDDVADKKEEGGYTFIGNLSQQFNRYLESYGYRYIIENSNIYVYPRTWQVLEKEEGEVGSVTAAKDSTHVPLLTRKAIKITPENALSIRKKRSASEKGEAGKDNNTGVKVTTLLDGRVQLKYMLFIVEDVETNPDLNGTYSIDSISHKLSYEGSDWTTTVTGVKVKNV